MTPGILPSAAPPPASLFAPLLRRSAQKVTKKARHPTRCFDSHPANQNPLRFSARRGCSDSTSMYCFAIAAIHRRDPAGFLPPRLRCSAPRTVPGSTNPCIPALSRGVGMQSLAFGSCYCFRFRFCSGSGFCGRMPPKGAPCGAARVRRISPQEGAHDVRPFAECTWKYIQRTPEHPAHSQGRMPGERATGGVFLWLSFFAQAKKVTRSPKASGSFGLQKHQAKRDGQMVPRLCPIQGR